MPIAVDAPVAQPAAAPNAPNGDQVVAAAPRVGQEAVTPPLGEPVDALASKDYIAERIAAIPQLPSMLRSESEGPAERTSEEDQEDDEIAITGEWYNCPECRAERSSAPSASATMDKDQVQKQK